MELGLGQRGVYLCANDGVQMHKQTEEYSKSMDIMSKNKANDYFKAVYKIFAVCTKK